MSYSYIKSVFPKFESSKIYDERIYNSLSSVSTATFAFQPSPINDQLQSFTQNLLESKAATPKDTIESKLPLPIQEAIKESAKTEIPLETTKKEQDTIDQSKDNLRFYNKPLPAELLKELYSNTNNNPEICESYINHVLSCSKCSSILTKQLGITNDKARIQEMMELGSYVIFGIFILLLLESIKRK